MHFRLLFHYIQLIHNDIYYRHIKIEGKENIPEKDEAVIIAANHQNAINDPLALEFAFPNRTVNLFAHGNLFKNPVMNRFFRAIHVIPAYRMRTDGEESLGKNYDEFSKLNELLFKGEWAGIFPEATNMTGHWLGEFSLGYLRMAFSAAETVNFEKDVKILPVSIHYDNYHRFRHNLLVRISPAVSLSQFYELYKTKPRTAQREANRLVRESIERNMLNVTDLDNYEAIDYIRETYGIKYCASQGKYYKDLTQKLDTDRELVRKLEEAESKDNEKVLSIYNRILKLKQLTRGAGIRDWVLTNTMNPIWMVIYGIVFLVGLPLFLLALIPNIAAYLAPIPICRKFDKTGGPFVMFKGGVQIVLNALVICPILYLAIFITLMCLSVTWNDYVTSICWFLLQPFLIIFGWSYYNDLKKYLSLIRFRIVKNSASMQEILALRVKLWRELDNLLLKNCN